MIGWRLLCGGLVFVAVSTCAAAGLAALAGKLMPLTAWLALVLGAAAGFFVARNTTAPRQKITVADTILFVIFALAATRAFLWVVYPKSGNLEVLSPHNLGDRGNEARRDTDILGADVMMPYDRAGCAG